MKRTLLAISVSLGLACAAAPALADDTARINQHGSGGSVMIEQVANSGANNVMVQQAEGWGGSNVHVSQSQVADSSAMVFQSGNNQVNVFQHDGANLNVEVNSNGQYGGYYGGYYGGESNFVMVDQSGFGASARVDQYGSSYNNANINQASQGGLTAQIMQSGSFNQAIITQAGSNMTAEITQGSYGSSNTASIHQRNY